MFVQVSSNPNGYVIDYDSFAPTYYNSFTLMSFKFARILTSFIIN
jgi:hypothetical protein